MRAGVRVFENFINGLKNGFKVANATRKLVFKDKSLFMYPILAAVIAIVAAIVIIVAAFGLYVAAHLQVQHGAGIAVFIITLIILYIVVFFTSTYLTIAMLIAFREYTSGKSITMGDALGRTRPYMKLILEWAIFYTVIATIIQIIEGAIRAAFSRYGIGGNIISGVLTGGLSLGLAAVTAFALPVIIDEKKGPIETIKLSASFIMKNFGDTFGGLLFAEIFQIVFLLIGLGLIFLGILVFGVPALGIALVVLGFLVITAGVLLRYVLFNCFKMIVYDYKTRKKLPKGFDAKLIDGSVKRKGKQSGGNPFSINPLGSFGGQQQDNI